MRLRDDGERIRALFQLSQLLPEIGELGGLELELQFRTQQFRLIDRRPPVFFFISEDDEGGDGRVEVVEEARVVNVEVLGKIGFALALYFDVNQPPKLCAVWTDAVTAPRE